MNKTRVLSAIFAGVILMVSAAMAAGKPKADPGAALAEKWIAAWNSHDADKFLALFTDDAFYEDVAYGEKAQGSAALRKFFGSEVEGVPDLQL